MAPAAHRQANNGSSARLDVPQTQSTRNVMKAKNLIAATGDVIIDTTALACGSGEQEGRVRRLSQRRSSSIGDGALLEVRAAEALAAAAAAQ